MSARIVSVQERAIGADAWADGGAERPRWKAEFTTYTSLYAMPGREDGRIRIPAEIAGDLDVLVVNIHVAGGAGAAR